MFGSRSLVSTACLTGLALFVAACGDPAAPFARSLPSGSPTLSSGVGATLIECPTDSTVSNEGIIDPLGGSVSAGGTTISIPAGAVAVPTTFRVTVPASRYMEVSITAGEAQHYAFASPVLVTLDYSRCTRNDIDKAALSVFYIDEQSKALLQNMGGTDDKVARRITFRTDHLSGYAIAD